VGFSNGKGFVAHKVQANDVRHRAGSAVSKMATHRIAHHLTQFLDGFALSGDGVTERGGDITAFHLVFAHFKDDLTHKESIARMAASLQAREGGHRVTRFPGDFRRANGRASPLANSATPLPPVKTCPAIPGLSSTKPPNRYDSRTPRNRHEGRRGAPTPRPGVAALDDPEALQATATFALEHREVEWEPVAIAAAALNFKRELDAAKGVPSGPPLPDAVVLPLPPSSAAGGVILPLPRGFV